MASKPSDDAPAPASGSSATASDCKLGILDLPQETQKDIVSHVGISHGWSWPAPAR